MIWTLKYNGTEKTLAAWGLIQVQRTLLSQGVDELSFVADGQPADAAPLFPFESTVVLQRDRTQNTDGSFSGGSVWFSGLVTQIPRSGAPDAERNAYKVSGPWWYLDRRVFEKTFNVFNGYAVPGDTSTATFIKVFVSWCYLFLVPSSPGVPLGKQTTGQQIIEALTWALKPFTDNSVTPPFQIGTVTPDLDVPIQEVKDITCAEVIKMCLRWSPDAVTYFDYTTSPPTFNCKRRSDFTPVNMDVSQT